MVKRSRSTYSVVRSESNQLVIKVFWKTLDVRLRRKTFETQDRGEGGGGPVVLVEELASKGINAHLVGTQARGLGVNVEIVKVVRRWKKSRVRVETMMRKEIRSCCNFSHFPASLIQR